MLSILELLEDECSGNKINIETYPLPENIKGLYYQDISTQPVITLDNHLDTTKEKTCILAEELGHYYTSTDDILIKNRVSRNIVYYQEDKASRWAINRLVPLYRLVEAFISGASNKYEVAEYLNVTESLLNRAINIYYGKYGSYKISQGWVIYFNPFGYLKNV